MAVRLVAADIHERARLVGELVPAHAEHLRTDFGVRATELIARRIVDGWPDDEVLDELERLQQYEFYYPEGRHDGMPRWREAAGPSLRERRAAVGLLTALRGGGPKRRRPSPVATPDEAAAAYAEHRSERKAAAALGISKTQLRRLLGLDS